MGMESVSQITMTASAAIAQYRFVKLTAAAKVIQAAAAGDDAVGISLEGRITGDITAGNDKIPVASMNGCKCFITAGAAIDVSGGAIPVTSDGTGRAVAVAAATDRIMGYALQSAGAANETIEMLAIKGGDRRDS